MFVIVDRLRRRLLFTEKYQFRGCAGKSLCRIHCRCVVGCEDGVQGNEYEV